MALKNLQTNLKSLKFGHDRIGGGSSNQPYIKSPIPDKIGEYGFLNTDFILRGGSKAITNSLTDVGRLTKYFTDVRNPSGLLFIAKQNLLSRMAVRTQASGLLVNEGVYTPLSTLIEAGGVAFGLHVNKQGLNPFGGFGGINTYSEAIELSRSEVGWDINDRLTVLYNFKIVNENPVYNLKGIKVNSGGVNVLSYSGGPGSFLGIGKTNIKFADQRVGINNPLLKTDPYKFFGNSNYYRIPLNEYLTRAGEFRSVPNDALEKASRFLYVTELWKLISEENNVSFPPTKQFDNTLSSIISSNVTNNTGNLLDLQNNNTTTYTSQDLIQISNDKSQDGISNYIGKSGITTPGDFRKKLRQNNKQNPNIGALINSPDYSGANAKNIESRVNLGDPGNRSNKNLSSYTNGASAGAVVGRSGGNASSNSYDKVNVIPLYTGTTAKKTSEAPVNDLIKFRIGVMDNDTPTKKTYIHFRAFLNTISDQYSSEWSGTKYIGRGENFYTYGGFDRKVSLSWTVAAQSKAELIPMYKKLNYLASVCAPDYSENGYMRGNMVTLTIGGYFYEQPGIITGISYEMNDDNSTWEIGINDSGASDDTVKELPHLIKVTGFNFIPIHDFVPRKQNIVEGNFSDLIDGNEYGPERYIALANGPQGKGYDNYGDLTPWETNPVTIPPQPKPQPIPSPVPQQTQQNGGGLLAVPTGLTTATPTSTKPSNQSITADQTQNVPYNWLNPSPASPSKSRPSF